MVQALGRSGLQTAHGPTTSGRPHPLPCCQPVQQLPLSRCQQHSLNRPSSGAAWQHASAQICRAQAGSKGFGKPAAPKTMPTAPIVDPCPCNHTSGKNYKVRWCRGGSHHMVKFSVEALSCHLLVVCVLSGGSASSEALPRFRCTRMEGAGRMLALCAAELLPASD